jgi:LAO/AO transport system kinase
MKEFRDMMTKCGELERQREKQHKVWMWNHIRDNILLLFKEHPDVQHSIPKLEHLVSKGAITSGYAADILLQKFMKGIKDVS